MTVLKAAGRLGAAVECEEEVRDETSSWHLRVNAGGRNPDHPNGQLVLRRVAWVDGQGEPAQSEDARGAQSAVHDWAKSRICESHLMEAARSRREAAVGQLADRGYKTERVVVRPQWRLAIGLGDEVPQEVGLRLHGTYGCPILPGSALKGITAAEGREEVPSDYHQILGSPRPEVEGQKARRGSAIFLDALPMGKRDGVLERDVMTPHVAEYYHSPATKAAAEYWNPNPVEFLTVGHGVRFSVHVLVHSESEEDAETDMCFAFEWLKKGLQERGIGAKTAAGYGYMEVPDEGQDP